MAKGGQTGKTGSSAMSAAWKLFDAGDKRAARAEATRILAQPPSASDAEEAKELLSRLSPPPSFKLFAILAACFITGLVLLALARG